MTEILKLEGTARENAGTGASRALRRNDQLPAIIYGEKKEGLKNIISLAYLESRTLLPIHSEFVDLLRDRLKNSTK